MGTAPCAEREVAEAGSSDSGQGTPAPRERTSAPLGLARQEPVGRGLRDLGQARRPEVLVQPKSREEIPMGLKGKRRCSGCGKFRWIHRWGKRPNGSSYYFCRPCVDDFGRVRKYEREMIEMLQVRGDV